MRLKALNCLLIRGSGDRILINLPQEDITLISFSFMRNRRCAAIGYRRAKEFWNYFQSGYSSNNIPSGIDSVMKHKIFKFNTLLGSLTLTLCSFLLYRVSEGMRYMEVLGDYYIVLVFIITTFLSQVFIFSCIRIYYNLKSIVKGETIVRNSPFSFFGTAYKTGGRVFRVATDVGKVLSIPTGLYTADYIQAK
jgi:hypothetical protein